MSFNLRTGLPTYVAASPNGARKSLKRKGARFGRFGPEIKAALADGQTIKGVRLWLDEEGASSLLLAAFGRIFAGVAEEVGADKKHTASTPAQPIISKRNPKALTILTTLSKCRCRLYPLPEKSENKHLHHMTRWPSRARH